MIPKSSKNHPQIIQKPHQNHTKPMQKSSQNDPKTDPGGTWNRTRHLPDASPKAEHQPTGVHRPVAKTGLPRVSYAPKSGVTKPSGLRRFFSAKMGPFAKMQVFCGKKSPMLPQGSLWRTLGSPGALLELSQGPPGSPRASPGPGCGLGDPNGMWTYLGGGSM